MTYINGNGDSNWIKLIDKCYSVLLPNENRPSIQMILNPQKKTFKEGFIWGDGFWIQNSYGFVLGAIPFLNPEWRETLQNSLNLFWDRIGDGKRTGNDKSSSANNLFNLVAPDGALGDCVLSDGIVYKQGDGDGEVFDWFYEGTAAGVVMQTELFLFERNIEKIKILLSKLLRAINFVEKTRADNNLYLVGASSNLLAPSFGGDYDRTTKTLTKSYLTGLLITQTKALKNMVEIFKLINKDGSADKLISEYENKIEMNLQASELLLTDEGYFVKSMSVSGEKHGIYGADKYGYFESVCNVDSIALGFADDAVSQSVYNKIASIAPLRQADIICNNYPHLDDTYKNYLNENHKPDSLGYKSGDWVDGGCWATVEGRAILAYMRLGKYDDAYKSADYYMKWAEDYRMDAPLSQWGKNTLNPWQKEHKWFGKIRTKRPSAVVIDNFAPFMCLLRGLFSYEISTDFLQLSINIPDTITELELRMPFYIEKKAVYIHYIKNADNVKVNGKTFDIIKNKIKIPASLFEGSDEIIYINFANTFNSKRFDIKASITQICPEMKNDVLHIESNMELEHILMMLKTQQRKSTAFRTENFRPMTAKKKKAIIELYEKSCF